MFGKRLRKLRDELSAAQARLALKDAHIKELEGEVNYLRLGYGEIDNLRRERDTAVRQAAYWQAEYKAALSRVYKASALEAGQQAQDAEIRRMLLEGASIRKICTDVFGYVGGWALTRIRQIQQDTPFSGVN